MKFPRLNKQTAKAQVIFPVELVPSTEIDDPVEGKIYGKVTVEDVANMFADGNSDNYSIFDRDDSDQICMAVASAGLKELERMEKDNRCDAFFTDWKKEVFYSMFRQKIEEGYFDATELTVLKLALKILKDEER